MQNLLNRIEKDKISLKDIIGENIFLIFGTTGSGKSTLANALISGSTIL